jgi:hypothetical protein
VLRREDTSIRLAPDAAFDAVLLGWGSFGHVLERAERFELLRACDRIAPNGPILLSIFHPKAAAMAGGMAYTPWGGFLAQPNAEELEQLAEALDREVIVSLEGPSSYATFV